MADHEAGRKRALGAFWPYQHCFDNRHGQFEGERQILELISLGAPLAGILNRLCSVIDVQIGDVMSLVSLADEEENHFLCGHAKGRGSGPGRFFFHGKSSVQQTLLGTLDIYACDSRRPTQDEYELIERVSHVAAIALQRHADEQVLQTASRRSGGRVVGAYQTTPFIN